MYHINLKRQETCKASRLDSSCITSCCFRKISCKEVQIKNELHQNEKLIVLIPFFRAKLCERNWSIFGSPTCSKNQPCLKIVFHYMTKKYTWSINELKVDQKVFSFFKVQFYNCNLSNLLYSNVFYLAPAHPRKVISI